MISLLLVSIKRKNNGLFAQKVSSVEVLAEKVKIVSWWWLMKHKFGLNYNLNLWWSNLSLFRG
jgi:hypothetical protein